MQVMTGRQMMAARWKNYEFRYLFLYRSKNICLPAHNVLQNYYFLIKSMTFFFTKIYNTLWHVTNTLP